MTKSENNVTVIRVRCNACSKNVTLCVKGKSKFKEGDGIGITCKNAKNIYDSLDGCSEELKFFRVQGIRQKRSNDPMLDELPEKIEAVKAEEEEE